MKEQEIYYYSDELNDEFSGSHITPRVIDEKYKYLHKNTRIHKGGMSLVQSYRRRNNSSKRF